MRLRVLSSLVAAVAMLAAQGASAANSVQSISLQAPAAGVARLQLQLSAPPRQKVFTVDKTPNSPHRVVIDLPGTVLASGLRLPTAAGPVRALRPGQQANGSLHLVLDLDRDLDPKVTVNGAQLVIEIGTATAASVAPSPPTPVRAAHAQADSGRDIIVAVDAGHGGKDPGASGVKGTQEKDVVLPIARELAKRINAEPGMKAVLIRNSDTFIDLHDRTQLARRARADIFISVHADAIRNPKVSGSSVYVLTEGGASSEAARLLAEEENAKGGVPRNMADDALASVLSDVSQTKSMTDSLDAAGRVLGHLDRVGAIRKTLVQQAGFAVLKSPGMPSILVETAYISNPAEEQKLRDPAHQAQIAAAIFNGVREYFRQSPPDGTLFARQKAASRAAATIVADSARP